MQQGLWSSGDGMENTLLEYKIGQNENFPQISTAHVHCNSTEHPKGAPRCAAVLSSPCLSAKWCEMQSGGNDKYRSGHETEDA